MIEETKTAQSDDNAVNNPTTEGSKNNENMVPQSRVSEISAQKNDFKAQLEESQKKNAEYEAARAKARETEMIANKEFETLNAEKDSKIERLEGIETKYNTYVDEERNFHMEKLSDTDKEFGEGMELTKLRKFAESKVQNPNAGKTNSQRQGVNPSGEFGGYNNPQEWAQKDPNGFQRHLEQTFPGYIK
jgi:predicted RNase H-like nuclease (RuvC/YqgF family)